MKVYDLSRGLARRLGGTVSATRRFGRSLHKSPQIVGTAILAGGMMFAGPADCTPEAKGDSLFSEDFEGLTPLLGPFISDTESGGDGTDWISFADAQSNGQLTGWSSDLTTTPTDGVAEFLGWTFMDPASWNGTAGQNREDFSLGQGTIAVADGDEYDDTSPGVLGGSSQAMNVFFSTPPIDLTSSNNKSSITLNFDSSFRPYDAQTGLVDVSFDGGTTFSNLLTLNTAAVPGGTSSLDRVNETISLNLGASAGDNSAILRFGFTDADNDWWWAVDNIDVVDGAPVAGIDIDRDSGNISIENATGQPIDFSGYSIISEAGTLAPSAWTSVDDNYDVSGNGSVDNSNEWIELSDASVSTDLSEGTLDSTTLAAGQVIQLGNAWQKYFDESDIRFEYIADGQVIDGLVNYSGTDFPEGDLNFDGLVTGVDWDQFVSNLGRRGLAVGSAATYPLGDLDLDGDSDHGDFLLFQAAYDDANGVGAFDALIASVPEPSSIILFVSAGLAMLSRRKTRQNEM